MPLQDLFGVSSLASNSEEVSSAIYLQVSIISQALIFVTRSQGWSFLERPGILLMIAFVVAQLVKYRRHNSYKELQMFWFPFYLISDLQDISLFEYVWPKPTIMVSCIKLDCIFTKWNRFIL